MTSLEELDRKLQDARERVRRADHLTSQQASAANQMREVTQLISQLEAQLAKEEKDVAKLEHGFRGFLTGVAGSKEEHLDRERAEVHAAFERLHGQRSRLDELTADHDRFAGELAGLTDARQTYQAVMEEKERLLVQQGSDRGRQLLELSQQLADTQSDLKEYGEAWHAGNAAAQAVGNMLRSLGSANTASTWDLLGGGVLADSVERGHLLEADKAAWYAQRALDVFARELADLGWKVYPRLPEVDTRWFADMFFDNIITDALKHRRINKTREAVGATAQWVGETVRSLATHNEGLARRRDDQFRQRERLITT